MAYFTPTPTIKDFFPPILLGLIRSSDQRLILTILWCYSNQLFYVYYKLLYIRTISMYTLLRKRTLLKKYIHLKGVARLIISFILCIIPSIY